MATGYAMLLAPSTNRVYGAAAPDLVAAELAVLDATVLGGRLGAVDRIRLGGVEYLAFTAAAPLGDAEIGLLSDVSGCYALFRRDGDALRPETVVPLARYDDDLLTILKYAGKTNEQFTQLLFNLTQWNHAAADPTRTRRLSVLDPLCGRGTTLNQALMYGHDAVGIDTSRRDVEAYATFLRTYARRKRLKHQASDAPVRREGAMLGRRWEITLAPDKESWAAGQAQRVSVCHLDTTRTRAVHRAGSFDLIVTDAPYGVQHGSHDDDGRVRGPLPLLAAALPVWAELLAAGGALGLSWNTHVAGRDAVLDALRAAGLQPRDDGPYRGFVHRVDQAIVRDLVVATKPGPA